MSLEIVLIIAFLSATSIQLYFWLPHFSTVLNRLPSIAKVQPYTVLICAHNEAANLAANLPAIAEQDTPPDRILVVDHGSTDHTLELLRQLRAKIPILEAIQVPRHTLAKKEALAAGLAHTEAEIVLLTDADCTPGSTKWGSLMVSCLGKSAACIGLAPLRGGKGLIARFAEYESMLSAFQYGAMAARGRPYMAVGRNLAYHTQSIRTGFLKITSGYLGGDDDLIITALRKQKKISYCGDPQATTYSLPPQSLPAFIRQKKRHVATSKAYDLRTKAEIFLFASSHWFHYLFLLGLLLLGKVELGMSIYGLRLLTIYVRYLRTGVPLHGKSLVPWLPLLDFLYALYYPMLTYFLMIRPSKKW